MTLLALMAGAALQPVRPADPSTDGERVVLVLDSSVEVSGGTVKTISVPIGPMNELLQVFVWLPPSYSEDDAKRYPVLYMHDGQNLFDRKLTNYDKEWGMDEAISRMAANGDLREWIVVGVRSPTARYMTLFPEKLVDFLPPQRVEALASVSGNETIERDALMGDEYLAWLMEVKKDVDRTFKTQPDAPNTAVMGSSMGGLMSLYAIAEYPGVFGQAAAVSIHYPLGAPDIEDVDANVADTTAAWEAYLATTNLDPAKNRIYMDHGTATLDQYYPPYADAFDAMMARHGWNQPNYMSRRYTGAEHDERAWSERVDIPLAFLDREDP